MKNASFCSIFESFLVFFKVEFVAELNYLFFFLQFLHVFQIPRGSIESILGGTMELAKLIAPNGPWGKAQLVTTWMGAARGPLVGYSCFFFNPDLETSQVILKTGYFNS